MRAFAAHKTLRRDDRGSTLLIVLALLSVLVLLATTLAFTSRLEVLSAHHFGEGVQRRTAVLTGVDDGGLALMEALPPNAVGKLDLAVDLKRLQDQTGPDGAQALRVGEVDVVDWQRREENLMRAIDGDATLDFPMTETLVSDSSARVNLNAGSYSQIALVIQKAIDGIPGYRGAAAPILAKRIIDWRYGLDGAPGEKGVDDNRNGRYGLAAEIDEDITDRSLSTVTRSKWRHLESFLEALPGSGSQSQRFNDLMENVDEPQEYIADIRYPAFGDDRRFGSVGDLYDVDGVTPELVRALESLVTVFSVSREMMSEKHDFLPKLDINRASAMVIYETLRREYGGEKDDLLLLQFAANIVDQRDADSVPTVLTVGSWRVSGLEMTPRLSEIYPDSLTPDDRGDDGQYVEISNPWQVALDLSGWTLDVGGMRHQLQGNLRPGEVLVVTDDYDNALDPSSEEDVKGTGSFYDVFGAVHGSYQRILELPTLNVFHQPGTYSVRLYSPEGALTDEMSYTIPREEEWSAMDSFARTLPFSPQTKRGVATPLAAPEPGDYRPEIANMPFVDVAELFSVFVDYDSGREDQWHPGSPVPVSPASTSPEARALAHAPEVIDARIVDLFTVEFGKTYTEAEWEEYVKNRGETAILDPWSDGVEADLTSKDILRDEKAVQELEALAFTRIAPPIKGWSQGRINLNTATVDAVEALGFNRDTAKRFVERRSEMMRDAVRQGQEHAVMYERLSDIVADEELWGGYDYGAYIRQLQRNKDEVLPPLVGYEPIANCPQQASQLTHGFLDRMEAPGAGLALLPFVTLSSRSFFLEGQALEASNDSEPKVSYIKARSLVALDRESPELVSMNLLP